MENPPVPADPEGAQAALSRAGRGRPWGLAQARGGALRYQQPRGAAPVPGQARRAFPRCPARLGRPFLSARASPALRAAPVTPRYPRAPPTHRPRPAPPAVGGSSAPSAKGPRVRAPGLRVRVLEPRVRIPRPPHPGGSAGNARKMW